MIDVITAQVQNCGMNDTILNEVKAAQLSLLQREIQLAKTKLRSESMVAKRIGVSRQFLNDVKKGNRPMPKERHDMLIELIDGD